MDFIFKRYYWNESNTTLTFLISAATPLEGTLEIVDLAGEILWRKAVSIGSGDNRIVVDGLGALTPGNYGYLFGYAQKEAISGTIHKN